VEPTPAFGVRFSQPKESPMKGIAAYILGVPVVVIILLYVTDVF